jgi:hypothetical protein
MESTWIEEVDFHPVFPNDMETPDVLRDEIAWQPSVINFIDGQCSSIILISA